MEDLRVIGVEDGALLVSSDAGERFRVAIDDAMRVQLRQAMTAPDASPRLAPREIQAHIRSGMSAQDVASITGAALEYVQRFEGPILAEREFVIESALAVPVHTAMDTEFGDSQETFGSAIVSRLRALNATGERWASWKDESHGWVVKLSFTSEQIDHDARWRFDPRKSALAPLNNEAETLSRQGELTGTLIPRLRAVEGHDKVADNSRFDSGAFVDREVAELRNTPHIGTAIADRPDADSPMKDTAPHLEAVPYGRIGAESEDNRDAAAPTNQTADLLEALRRRRGEREVARYEEDDSMADHPSTGNIRLVDIPLTDFDDGDTARQPASVHNLSSKSSKRGRAAMPSWDEIVFGARSDDDPA
ncbi:MAG: DUF3071 domain-containing protein [Cryobacterium sp.]|nr:DUF3071 domain-containing protein [Cryobacterium sp.]